MEKVERAVCFAAEKHNGQKRKMSSIPYLLHPMEVAAIAGTMTDDADILCAAVLHDTVEDTETTLEEIREQFGRRVALLVMTETEDKRADRPPAETWKERKEETLMILENTKDQGVRIMWLSDKLSNIRSISREYRKCGDAVWQNLNQKDPEMQAWYYRSIAKYLKPLEGFAAYQEYVQLVEYLFHDHKGVMPDED